MTEIGRPGLTYKQEACLEDIAEERRMKHKEYLDMNTQAIALDELTKSGKLSELQQKTFQVIKDHNGATITEIAIALRKWPNSISGRISELRKMGKIKAGLKRHCHISQKLAMVWVVNDNREKQLEFV
jgi:hypothetical protein